MTIDYGTFIARTRQVEDLNFDLYLQKTATVPASADLTIAQDLQSEKDRQELRLTKSGIVDPFLAGAAQEILPTVNSVFPLMDQEPNEFVIQGFQAKVGRFVFPVRGSRINSASQFNSNWNFVKLGAPPSVGLRYDLVFLEVWRAQIRANLTDNKPDATHIYPLGNTQWGDPSSYPADDFIEPLIGAEHSSIIQIQYRIRVVEGVGFLTDPMTSPLVLAQGATSAPIAGRTWSKDSLDSGLYFNGTGTATDRLALGGVPDGVVWAIPLYLIARRNSNAFNRATNKNGSDLSGSLGTPLSIATSDPASPSYTPSDRPDGLYADQIVLGDVVQYARHQVFLSGINYESMLERELLQIQTGDHQFFGRTNSDGSLRASDDLLQFDGIAPVPPGQAGIDDIASPDDTRLLFSASSKTQKAVATLPNISSDQTAGLVTFDKSGYSGYLAQLVGANDVVQIETPTSPTGIIFPPIRPVLRWRSSTAAHTAGDPVVLTNPAATVGIQENDQPLNRLMVRSGSSGPYKEIRHLERGFSTDPEMRGSKQLVIASSNPYNLVSIDLSSEVEFRNNQTSALNLEYWDGTAWQAVPGLITDGTSVSMVSFAQDGNISFDVPPGWKKSVFEGGPALYYLRMSWSADFDSLAGHIPVLDLTLVLEDNDWIGFGTSQVVSQIDTTDPTYDASDSIDVEFDLLYPVGNGLTSPAKTMLRGWWNDGAEIRDLSFARSSETSRDRDINLQTSANATIYQWFLRDWNFEDSNYSQDHGRQRSVFGYIVPNGADVSYTVTGPFSATVFDLENGDLGPSSIENLNVYRFVQETAPGAQDFDSAGIPLSVATPPTGLIRNPSGNYTVTFTTPPAANQVIRFEASVDVAGFVHTPEEKSIDNIARTTDLTFVQDPTGTTWTAESPGLILSYGTAYNTSTFNNDPVVFVDAAPTTGSFTREFPSSFTIVNDRQIIITFGAPLPGGTSDIVMSVTYQDPIASTDAWTVSYQRQPYQGLGESGEERQKYIDATDFDVVYVSKRHFLHSIGTGATSTIAQRDRRFGALATRLPLVSPATLSPQFEDELSLDGIQTITGFNTGVLKEIEQEINHNDSLFGTKLREGLAVQLVTTAGSANNAFRGLNDRQLYVLNSDNASDYIVESLLKDFIPATNVAETDSLRGWQYVQGAILRDKDNGELFILVVTATFSESDRYETLRLETSSPYVAFDLFPTVGRYLD